MDISSVRLSIVQLLDYIEEKNPDDNFSLPCEFEELCGGRTCMEFGCIVDHVRAVRDFIDRPDEPSKDRPNV